MVVEPRVVHEVEIELRVAGVAAARREPDRPADVRREADLVAGERTVPHVFVRARAASLEHEVGHHAVDGQPVVAVLAREPHEPPGVERRLGGEELHLEPADLSDRDRHPRGREAFQLAQRGHLEPRQRAWRGWPATPVHLPVTPPRARR